MILSVSRRTDIPANYSDWFWKNWKPVFENLKIFKGNFLQVVKMIEDFIEALQEKALKKENL